MSDRYIKESDIIKMCEKAADTCHDLYMKSFDMATDKMRDFDFTAIAWFGQQERMYRYEIPSVIREVDGISGVDDMDIRKIEEALKSRGMRLKDMGERKGGDDE